MSGAENGAERRWRGAPRRPRPSHRSRTTRSSRTATPARWSLRTAPSIGCASRASTHPSVFGTLLDRGAGTFRVGPFGINVPTARDVRARHERRRDDLEDPERLDRGPGRADRRSSVPGRHSSHRTRVRRPTTTPTTCSSGPSICLEGRVEVELVVRARLRLRPHAGRPGPWLTRIATSRTRPARVRRSACTATWPSGIEAE